MDILPVRKGSQKLYFPPGGTIPVVYLLEKIISTGNFSIFSKCLCGNASEHVSDSAIYTPICSCRYHQVLIRYCADVTGKESISVLLLF